MTSQSDKAAQFLSLHHAETPLLLPDPWDTGSARVLVALGFSAVATTSSGFAATLTRPDVPTSSMPRERTTSTRFGASSSQSRWPS
ncbi:MAG TPA: isocitrate lyase/phosphoenolpyruvate mutase family protein [Acidimicrobiia bacterium]|nr:isocitrate lyase/phosphoenolpyruvate mutase family protein [Acidimicrobiia bacterium]